jgi:hypothetical protein
MIMFEPSSTAQILSGDRRARHARTRNHRAFSDLANLGALGIEFKEARALAAGIDEDVASGIGRHADAFAEIELGGKLQQIGR